MSWGNPLGKILASSRGAWLWLCWILIWGAVPAKAQATGEFLVHPNHERGLSANTAYEVGLADHLNLFNGNLTFTLPIGQRYPVSEGFSWGLTLASNSQIWDWEQEATFCDHDGNGPGSQKKVPGTSPSPAMISTPDWVGL